LRLTEIFREQISALTESSPNLEDTLVALWTVGKTAWPHVVVDAEKFVGYLARRVDAGQLESSLTGLHAADLYLCCACATGKPAALAAFEERYLSQVGGFVARMGVSSAFVDDLEQTLRERLFVGCTPKICEYAGRGGLHNWLRVVTVRTALNLLRNQTELLDEDPQTREKAAPAIGTNPESACIRDQYREQLTEAMNDAFGQLSNEQRHLLRRHFLEGITLDQLALNLGVHRATIVRRIAEARRAILQNAQRRLRDRFNLHSAELGSLMGVVRSGLNLSITRLLQSGAA
jgi:RNA polymerase sigma-70 factor (ECF subfamily)